MRVRPVAIAPNISARWEMDLSPGTVSRPRRGGAGELDSGRGAVFALAWLSFDTGAGDRM